MNRTGRVIVIMLILIGCAGGLLWFGKGKIKKAQPRQVITMKENIYITSVSGSVITVLEEGNNKEYTASSGFQEDVTGVADLTFTDGQLIKISKKPDRIKGKLLKVTDETVEIWGYGTIDLDPSFCIYVKSRAGQVSLGKKQQLTVGNQNVEFVVARGKVCAVIIQEEEVTNIRVILKNKETQTYDFEQLEFQSNKDFFVTEGKKKTTIEAGKTYTLGKDTKSEVVMLTPSQGAEIGVLKVQKEQKTTYYPGALEAHKKDGKWQLINELDLESYLYSVIPSEMPTEYEIEALKAQAICARTYALAQIQNNRLAKYGAHVDDTTAFQVYNRFSKDERSIQAVNDTKGKVICYQGSLASAYFYSSSCGVSEGIKNVWYAKKDVDYLPCQTLCDTRENADLDQEKDFQKFITEKKDSIDASSPWYRWTAKISKKDIRECLESRIQARYEVNPSQIQAEKKDSLSEIGDIRQVRVIERGKSGVVMGIEVKGEKNTVKIYTEYNVRLLLAGKNGVYTRGNGTIVKDLSLLPSGYFYVEEKGEDIQLTGGGYGHGVGMSQTGANQLAKNGKTSDQIISYFFPTTSLESVEFLLSTT